MEIEIVQARVYKNLSFLFWNGRYRCKDSVRQRANHKGLIFDKFGELGFADSGVICVIDGLRFRDGV